MAKTATPKTRVIVVCPHCGCRLDLYASTEQTCSCARTSTLSGNISQTDDMLSDYLRTDDYPT